VGGGCALAGGELVEPQVASAEELQAGVRALKAGEVDAFFAVADAIAQIQTQLIIDTARRRGYRLCSNS
jgi:hypothetical protein